MNITIRLISFVLFVVLIHSCKSNKSSEPKTPTESKTIKNSVKQVKPAEAPFQVPNDYDSYFSGTENIKTSFGPTSITRNFMQDSNGIIWLATWDGIMSYDGTNFTNHTNESNLRRWRVFTMLEDSKGTLWFGTVGAGLYKYTPSKDKSATPEFINITKEDGLVHNSMACIYEDNDGNIWFGTQGGISVYDGNSFKNYTTEDGLTDNDINSIVQDKNGKFWIAARGKACTFDGNKFELLTRDNDITFSNVRTIIKDENDNIWLGGNPGLWVYDYKTFINYSLSFYGYMYESKSGDIWTSSEGATASDWQLKTYQPYNPANTITAPIFNHDYNSMIFGVMEDRDNNIWYGALNGAARYDGKDFEYFREDKVSPPKN